MRNLARRLVRAAIGEPAFAALRGLYWPLKLRFTAYEPETELLPLLVPRGGVCIDVGGNFGQFASYLARAAGPEGVVHSFEPLTYNGRMFQGVMRRMKLTNVVFYPYAVGAKGGTLRIAVTARNTGEAHVSDAGEEVEVVTLDEWGAHLGRLDFIKIDVEGFELDVLRGASGLLQRFRPAIVCEVTVFSEERYGVPPAASFAFLRALGYRGHVWREGRLVPVERPVDGAINYIFLQ